MKIEIKPIFKTEDEARNFLYNILPIGIVGIGDNYLFDTMITSTKNNGYIERYIDQGKQDLADAIETRKDFRVFKNEKEAFIILDDIIEVRNANHDRVVQNSVKNAEQKGYIKKTKIEETKENYYKKTRLRYLKEQFPEAYKYIIQLEKKMEELKENENNESMERTNNKNNNHSKN